MANFNSRVAVLRIRLNNWFQELVTGCAIKTSHQATLELIVVILFLHDFITIR